MEINGITHSESIMARPHFVDDVVLCRRKIMRLQKIESYRLILVNDTTSLGQNFSLYQWSMNGVPWNTSHPCTSREGLFSFYHCHIRSYATELSGHQNSPYFLGHMPLREFVFVIDSEQRNTFDPANVTRFAICNGKYGKAWVGKLGLRILYWILWKIRWMKMFRCKIDTK